MLNDKSYIGKTIRSLHLRKGQHLRSNETTHFHRALRKYGKDMFDWSVIKETKTEKELDNQEIKFINLLSAYTELQYNIPDERINALAWLTEFSGSV